jgi:hypothetical protein
VATKSVDLPSVKVQVILGMLPSGNNQKHSLGQIDLFCHGEKVRKTFSLKIQQQCIKAG